MKKMFIEKRILQGLILLWIVSKPFRYLKYTNLTIGIISAIIMIHYFFSILYERKKIRIYKILKTTIALVLVGSALVFTLTQVLIYSEPFKDSRKLNEGEIDYLIVLGAGLRGKELSRALKYRLDRVLDLNMDTNTYIVVSGGQGDDELITEASAMSGYLIENGIEKGRIILEEKSKSTFENFKFTLRKLESEGFIVDDKSNFALVTNDFHIFRSKYILSKLGYDSIGIAAKTPGTVKLDYFFREFYAVINTVIFDF